MRNAFIVLVSLCTGLVSGFIVPSSVSEPTSHRTLESKNSSNTTEEDENLTSTMIPTRFSVLPKSRSDIDEKELYEHATEKQNNQSERAFVYINQKYKKPVRNKIIKMLPLDKPELVRIIVTPPPTLTGAPQTPCPSTFDSAPNTNSYFQGYDFSDKQSQEMASYFAAPSIFRCNFRENAKKSKDNLNLMAQSQASNRIDERRDYFELLKPPILRPVSRANTKSKYDSISQNDFSSLSPSNTPYKESYLKMYNLKNQYLSKANAATRQDDFRKNYGFHGEFLRRPAFQTNKDLVSRVEDVNFEGDFINEDDTHRMFENQEEDKLLDKYLKDTLEEQVTGTSDKGNVPECSYRDCILQTTKQYTNNGLLIKPDCKCGKRLNVKQVDPFARDRPLREETKRNDTMAKSSEMNYYEDILSGESGMGKQDDDVIRPPHKYNETAL